MRLAGIKRRYKLLLSGTLCAILIIFVVSWWPRPPFRFLGWNRPVRYDSQPFGSEQLLDWTYAFRADFDEVRARVEAELFPLGYEITYDDHRLGYRAVQYLRKAVDKSGEPMLDYVVLFQDMRYQRPQNGETYSLVGYPAPGWVSFSIKREVPPDYLDTCLAKIREWWEKLRPAPLDDR